MATPLCQLLDWTTELPLVRCDHIITVLLEEREQRVVCLLNILTQFANLIGVNVPADFDVPDIFLAGDDRSHRAKFLNFNLWFNLSCS